MTTYLCQLGTYNPLTDAFTLAVDLNDGQTFEIDRIVGIDLPPPGLNVFAVGNPRLHGVRVTHTSYGERTIAVELMSGPAATYAALLAAIRSLIAVQEQVRLARVQAQLGLGAASRVCLLLQPPGSVTPVYADVLAMEHDVAEVGDVAAWVRLLQEGIACEFTCAPFLRSPRVTLANDLLNPGFEAPGGSNVGTAGVTAFNDSFANTQAYTLVSGGAPTVASNIMTLAASSQVSFGSPAWGPLYLWQLRFKYPAGGAFFARFHQQDASNYHYVLIDGGQIAYHQVVAGTDNNQGHVTCALTGATWYWLQIISFPGATPNYPPQMITAVLNDSAGTPGTTVAGTVPLPGASGSSGLSGTCGLVVNAVGALQVGGAFANVQQVQLFGPGGWSLLNSGGTGVSSGPGTRPPRIPVVPPRAPTPPGLTSLPQAPPRPNGIAAPPARVPPSRPSGASPSPRPPPTPHPSG